MFKPKTILCCRKSGNNWLIRKGKNKLTKHGPGISTLFRLIFAVLQDKSKIYDIYLEIKRRR